MIASISPQSFPMLQTDPPVMQAQPPEPTANASEGYSIRVVARITGISVDTLRVWERRYGLPTPIRNATGVRVYTEGDVERLVLVARALKMGVRAGEAIRMEVKALTQLVAEVPILRQQVNKGIGDSVDALLFMVKAGDMSGLHREIGRICTV
ncbi:MAG TPA: MerR family transcriptional regulator, partial [Polyangiaceae bacterium]